MAKLKSDLTEILWAYFKRYENSWNILILLKYLLVWFCACGMVRSLKFVIQGAFQANIWLVHTNRAVLGIKIMKCYESAWLTVTALAFQICPSILSSPEPFLGFTTSQDLIMKAKICLAGQGISKSLVQTKAALYQFLSVSEFTLVVTMHFEFNSWVDKLQWKIYLERKIENILWRVLTMMLGFRGI